MNEAIEESDSAHALAIFFVKNAVGFIQFSTHHSISSQRQTDHMEYHQSSLGNFEEKFHLQKFRLRVHWSTNSFDATAKCCDNKAAHRKTKSDNSCC